MIRACRTMITPSLSHNIACHSVPAMSPSPCASVCSVKSYWCGHQSDVFRVFSRFLAGDGARRWAVSQGLAASASADEAGKVSTECMTHTSVNLSANLSCRSSHSWRYALAGSCCPDHAAARCLLALHLHMPCFDVVQ